MIREQVVITGIRITKAGQIKHFQVKLPKNTTRIIGVELGGRWLAVTKDGSVLAPSVTMEVPAVESPVSPKKAEAVYDKPREWSRANTFRRSLLVGELKLQSCEEANIFYAADFRADTNIAYGDFSQNAFWKPNVFTHQTQTFEECVIVDGDSTIIQGVYKDRYAEQTKEIPNYLVNVYVWTERQEPDKAK